MPKNAAFHLSLYCLLRQYHTNSQKKDQSPLTPKIAANHVIHKSSFAKYILYINPSLVLVQPRKTGPYITERLLMGCKESYKQNISLTKPKSSNDVSQASQEGSSPGGSCSCCDVVDITLVLKPWIVSSIPRFSSVLHNPFLHEYSC